MQDAKLKTRSIKDVSVLNNEDINDQVATIMHEFPSMQGEIEWWLNCCKELAQKKRPII